MISVVLPTYNHLPFLPGAVADIVAQSFADWELIVVDDGSTDGTADWLADQRDTRLRVLRQANAGPDAAINAGMAAARAACVTWVSADNRAAPYFLAAMHAALLAAPEAAFAYSPYHAIGPDGRLLAAKTDNWLCLREMVTGTPRGIAGFLYRRAIHGTVGFYRGYSCDTRMWAAIAARFPSVFVLEPTVAYRFHDDRASLRAQDRIAAERAALCRDFLAEHGAVDARVLRLLYPGLAQAPQHLPDAACDFSARLGRCGLAEAGMALAIQAASICAPAGLPRAVCAVAFCARGADPLSALWDAVQANPALTPVQRDAALGIAAGLAETGCAPPLLEASHPLLLLERPRSFSYAAWTCGRAGALPAF